MTNYQITPPPELLKSWEDRHFDEEEHVDVLLIEAYQAGADQELEACCAWIPEQTPWDADKLRAARRPQSPSLKEQALAALAAADGADHPVVATVITADQHAIIRRALEQLDD